MISFEFLTVLVAGLGMGILHAFDPDHVMTMSSLGAPLTRGVQRSDMRFLGELAMGASW